MMRAKVEFETGSLRAKLARLHADPDHPRNEAVARPEVGRQGIPFDRRNPWQEEHFRGGRLVGQIQKRVRSSTSCG